MKYRRNRFEELWHWCLNCTGWPQIDYEQADGVQRGPQCIVCEAKTLAETCKLQE